MNSKSFVSVLRKIIREEVKAAVRQEVKSLLSETRQQPRQAQVARQANRIPPVSFDGPLASILNETAQTMYSTSHQEEWQDMGGTLTADQAQGFGLAALMNQETSITDSTPSHFAGDPTMAFVKDYSAVMKAADKVAGNR